MIRRTCGIFATILLTGATVSAQSAPRPLVIYFVDVEGGQATLIKAPAGEAFLIDAGLTQIDHLMLTHYHADHFGGVLELA